MASLYNETRQNAESKNNKLVDLIYKKTKRKLTQEFERTYSRAIKAYDNDGLISTVIFEEHREKLFKILQEMYLKAATAGQARILYTFIKAGWIKEDEQKQIVSKMENIFKLYADSRAQMYANKIASTTEDDIQRIIEKDKRKEENGRLIGLLKDVLKEAKDRSIYRSLVVGVTSIHSAISFSQRISAGELNDSDYEIYKVWVTEKDEVVRQDHARMENVKIPINDVFIVGGEEMREPGDDSASLKQWINCRCFLRYRREKR